MPNRKHHILTSVLSGIASSGQAVRRGKVLAAERRRPTKVPGERAEAERGQRTSEALCRGQGEREDESEADCELQDRKKKEKKILTINTID